MAGVRDGEVSRRGPQRSYDRHSLSYARPRRLSHARPRRPREPRWRPPFQRPPGIPEWSQLPSATVLRLGHGRRLDGPGGSRGDTAFRSAIDQRRSCPRSSTCPRSEVRVSANTERTELGRFAYGHRTARLADRGAIVSGHSLKKRGAGWS